MSPGDLLKSRARLVARLEQAGLFTLHVRLTLSPFMPSPNAPMAQAGQQGFGLDGPEPRVRPLQPLRPLNGLISASRPHGGQRVPQGRHSERHCDGFGSNLRLLLHWDINPDYPRCPERSPAKNSTVRHLLLTVTRRLVTPAPGTVRDGVLFESRVAKAV